MLIGHLPAGYIFSKLLSGKLAGRGIETRHIIPAGMLGSIAPDLDMFYFFLVDNRQHHHHTYWSHYPIVWLTLLLLFAIRLRFAGNKGFALPGLLFSASGFMHLMLDSIVGKIWWLAPFVDRPFSIYQVAATYRPWWINFVVDWSFLMEMALVAWAAALCLWSNMPRRKTSALSPERGALFEIHDIAVAQGSANLLKNDHRQGQV